MTILPSHTVWQRRLTVFVGLPIGIAILLAVAAQLIWLCYWTSTLNAAVEGVRRRRGIVWFSETPRPTAAEQETAAEIIQAAKAVPKDAQVADILYRTIGAKPPTLDNEAQRLSAWVSANRIPLDKITTLARAGPIRFPNEVDAICPASMPLPEVDALGPIQGLLSAEALIALANADVPRSYAAVFDKLAVADLARNEPFLVLQFVRSRYVNQALDLLQLILAQGHFDDVVAKALGRRFAELEGMTRLRSAVLSERAVTMTLIRNMGSKEVGVFFESVSSIGPGGSLQSLMPFGRSQNRWWGSWLYRPRLLRQQVCLLDVMTELADTIDQAGPEGERAFNAALERSTRETARSPVLAALLPNTAAPRQLAFDLRQRLCSASVALRVCGYRAAHGALPTSLGELSRDGGAPIPPGILSGHVPTYEVERSGFAIFDLSGDKHMGQFKVHWTQ